MDKRAASAREALGDVADGATVMSGGFVRVGTPWRLIEALHASGAGNLTLVACGITGEFDPLLESGRIRRVVTGWSGTPTTSEENPFQRLVREHRIELELVPQGTLAERIRAGGAGIPAFYTPTAVGTVLAEGRELREFDGVTYLLERWLRADIALVRAWQADRFGNLRYRQSANNFNAPVAMAGARTIAEAEEVVEQIDPELVQTPGIFVQQVVHVPDTGPAAWFDPRLYAPR